jgi:hypothetical protein
MTSPNPYEPPADSSAPPAGVPQGSRTVRVLGFAAIVAGCLVTLASAYEVWAAIDQAGNGIIPAGGSHAAGVDATMADARAVDVLRACRGVAMIVMSLALVAVGVGLRGERERWRRRALSWSGVALLFLLGRALYWELAIAPHFHAILDRMRGSGVAPDFLEPMLQALETQISLGETMEYATIGVLAVFPVVLLQVLTRRAVRDAMRP